LTIAFGTTCLGA